MTFNETKRYKQAVKVQWQNSDLKRELRRQQGWQLAHNAAQMLQRDFQVKRIVLFGSLTQPDCFTQWSDVDLAAWGLTSENWLQAILTVYEMSVEIELNLVDVRTCSPDFVEKIQQEGIQLCPETSLTEFTVS